MQGIGFGPWSSCVAPSFWCWGFVGHEPMWPRARPDGPKELRRRSPAPKDGLDPSLERPLPGGCSNVTAPRAGDGASPSQRTRAVLCWACGWVVAVRMPVLRTVAPEARRSVGSSDFPAPSLAGEADVWEVPRRPWDVQSRLPRSRNTMVAAQLRTLRAPGQVPRGLESGGPQAKATVCRLVRERCGEPVSNKSP